MLQLISVVGCIIVRRRTEARELRGDGLPGAAGLAPRAPHRLVLADGPPRGPGQQLCGGFGRSLASGVTARLRLHLSWRVGRTAVAEGSSWEGWCMWVR